MSMRTSTCLVLGVVGRRGRHGYGLCRRFRRFAFNLHLPLCHVAYKFSRSGHFCAHKPPRRARGVCN